MLLHSRQHTVRSRNGSLLLECVAGLVALGIALVVISRTTQTIDRQWRLTTQERLAAETLDNAMELALALDWGDITAERLADIQPPPQAIERLHRWSLSVEVAEEATPITGKRLQFVLTWRPTPAAEPLRRTLTTWVYSVEGVEP
ncbi:hypothetical protein [Botrimarina mediterranea]|uniref:Type II secretion system protein n=1 Tax=Botrimarina mediterranea TaxID=2528022 RepID=A0A518K948_9BACT|nr:hypothetical protein [Botrimarina mediterranea]QDV74328.1 hypothetical protein Spa11_25300 [Botrimarina mediterranea]QDV78922.1 hypothetical protein K2D_25310 [Planctomycetes bacterium K2D]